MKAMLAGFGAIVVISVIAHFALQYAGLSAQQQNTGEAVRLE